MSSSPCATLRLMLPQDLPSVLALQARCYSSDFHEPEAAFASKLHASPDSCWVMAGEQGVQAYLVSLPIQGPHLPMLHASAWSYPGKPDWLYLHDMSVAPQARGSGASKVLLQQAQAFAREHRLPDIGLIAVQDSAPYWAKQGFLPDGAPIRLSPDKLASFGRGAIFMHRQTPSD